MHFPDYHGGSIVNLMSSIATACGGRTPYAGLRILPKFQAKNIVLLIIDGLGFDYLQQADTAFLHEHLVGEMTSVFSSTTACAIPTFLTGVAPKQHAMTGWHMLLKELGTVAKILPYTARFGGSHFAIEGRELLDTETFFERITRKGYAVVPEEIREDKTDMFRGGKVMSYSTLQGFVRQIRGTLRRRGSKYVYAYWPFFDRLVHEHGTEHAEPRKHLKELDTALSRMVQGVSDTVFVIAADHGFMDLDFIELEEHPRLAECLSLPLCGEDRCVHCYVYPARKRQFEEYVKKHLSDVCTMRTRKELLEQDFYGLFEAHPKLYGRIGDYVLVCKKQYAIRDTLLGERHKDFVANHGGMSRDEMVVPLVVYQKI